MIDKPKQHTVWKHHSGRLYEVLYIANDVEDPKPDYPVMVVYQNVENYTVWAGRLDDWHRRMTLVGDSYFSGDL